MTSFLARRSWPAFLLLGGALLLLVDLYLPWQEGTWQHQGGRAGGVLDPLNAGENLTVDGWSSEVGVAAGIFALLLAALAVVALARPNLAQRLPLGRCALSSGYFGLATGVATRSDVQQQSVVNEFHFHDAYGTYLGLGGGLIVLLAAGEVRRRELTLYRSASKLVVVALVVGVLASFLLPWERYGPITFPGIVFPAATGAAVLAIWLLGAVWRDEAAAQTARLALALSLALLTAAAFSSTYFPGGHAHGAWVGLGTTGAIVALALIDARGMARPELPSWPVLATCGAAALLFASLFLPWQRTCYGAVKEFDLLAGRCISTNGWMTSVATAAALLALGLVVATLVPRSFPVPTIPLAAGIGLLVATLGFSLMDRSGQGLRLEFGYGSLIGFAAAALLLALVMWRARLRAFKPSRIPVRLAPIAACVAYLVVVVVPWWGVLPYDVLSALRFEPVSWLTITGVFLAIWLLQLWVRQIATAVAKTEWLVLLPLAMLALASLGFIRLGRDVIGWGRGIVAGLCLLLTLLGLLEQRGGLENVRVPAILRVDRL